MTIGTGIGGGLISTASSFTEHPTSRARSATRPSTQRTPLQMRQLRLPRGVRVGPGDRGRAREALVRGEAVDAASSSAATSTRSPRKTVYKRRAKDDEVAARSCARRRTFSAPASLICSTSSTRRRRHRRRRDAGGRAAVRAVARRSASARVQARGRSVSHRAGELRGRRASSARSPRSRRILVELQWTRGIARERGPRARRPRGGEARRSRTQIRSLSLG